MNLLNKYPILNKIYFFFPAQLAIVHVQRNLFIMFFWVFLVAILKGWWGKGLGLHFLFLEPEYLGVSGFWAFFINGLCLSCFFAAFNLSSYLINSHRFPFLATLRRPFLRYCINNFLIPFLFIAIYVRELYYFKNTAENLGAGEGFFLCLIGLLSGFLLFLSFFFGYFFAISNDLKRIFGIDPDELEYLRVGRRHRVTRVRTFRLPKQIFTEGIPKSGLNTWRTVTYLHHPFLIKRTRNVDHYPKELLLKVFNRNHFNALLFELFLLVSLVTLGLFREISIFQIPASAAILLALTLFMMLVGAFQFIFGRWNFIFIFSLFLLLDLSVRNKLINFHNYAYGLDYSISPINYNMDSLGVIARKNPSGNEDIATHIAILERRKAHLDSLYGEKKHPYFVVNVSGGGSKMSLWAVRVMQHLDSLTQNKFSEHLHIISGSSGGMIGAAYYREIYLQHKLKTSFSLYSDSLLRNISKDILNPIASSIALNDLFIRTGTLNYEGKVYPKDRAWAFENTLSKNTGNVLSKKVIDYYDYEVNAQIPLMLISPSVVEDGRRMLISPLPVSFLSEKSMLDNVSWHPKLEVIEFNKMFKNHGAEKLSMTTALRMNATFPLVLPPVTLPTEPSISLYDAGIRDNYGDMLSMKYLYFMREWFKENASEIIVLEIGDELRADHDRYKDRKTVYGLLDGFFAPFGGVLGNVTAVQVYNNETVTWLLNGYYDGKITHVEMDLSNFEKEEISISFHLTEAEKNRIKGSLFLPWNQKSIEFIQKVLQ